MKALFTIVIFVIGSSSISYAEDTGEGGYGLNLIPQLETLVNHAGHEGDKGRIVEKVDEISRNLEKGLDSFRKESKSIISKLIREKARYKDNPKILKRLDDGISYQNKILNERSAKVSNNIKALKGSTKALAGIGTALNIADLVTATKNAYKDIEDGKAEAIKTFLPVAEAIIAFEPISGGLLHIKKEANNLANLNRGIGEEYRNSIDGSNGVLTRYFKQYNTLANKAFSDDAETANRFLELFKHQREGMISELDDLYSVVESSLPFASKKFTLERIAAAKELISSPSVYEKQKNFISVFQNKYQARQDYKKEKEVYSSQLSAIESKKNIEITKFDEIYNSIPSVSEGKKTEPSLDDKNNILASKKKEAKSLLDDNKKRAEEYEEAYLQYKNDPDNSELKQRVDKADRLLRESTAAYIAKRDEVQALGGEYTGGAYSRDSIRDRIDDEFASSGVVAETGIIDSEEKTGIIINDDSGKKELEPETAINPELAGEKSQTDLEQKIDEQSRAQLILAEKIQPLNEDLKALNNRISEKRSEIDSLRQQLANLGGSASPEERFRIRANLIKYRLIKRIYDNNDGDINKLSVSERLQIKALSKTLPGDWIKVFINTPTRYANAQSQSASLASAVDSPEAQRIQRKIDQLESQITALSDVIDKKTEERRSLVVQYEDSQKELIALVEEINDATKEEIGNNATPNNLYEKLHGAVSLIGSNALGYRYQYDGGFLTVDNDNSFDATEQFKSSSDGGNSNHYSSTITINNPTPTDGYQYTAWGKWTHPNLILTTHDGKAFNVTDGHYVMGVATKDIPKTGTATYTGNLKGDYIDTPSSSGIVQKDAIGGTINLNVNFASSSMSATLNATRNGSSWATAQMNNINIESGNDFYHQGTGNEVVGGGSAGLSGTFYGPNAEEAGGGFYINKQSEGSGASGVFRAKKQ